MIHVLQSVESVLSPMVIKTMGVEPILTVKWPVTIGTMLNFDGDVDGDGDSIRT